MTKQFIYKDAIAERYLELQEQILAEDRVDFVKKQYKDKINTDHDANAFHKDSDSIVGHFAEHGDPTKKKLYTNWIVGQYKKSGMSNDELAHRKLTRQAPVYQEDAPKIHGILSKFDEFKHKLPKKDINQYDSVKEVSDAIQPYVENPNKHTVDENPHPGRTLKYEDDNLKIYHLHDKEASKELYGGGSEHGKTDWCTAYKTGNNMFDTYNKSGNLHVIHDKKAHKVFQYFVGGNNGLENQFMNAHDEEIPADDFKRIAPSLHKAWDEHPDLLE